MAYVTGSAGSITAVLTALASACTANGWSQSGDILYKGGCHIKVTADVGNNRLAARVGNGHSGASITDGAPQDTYLQAPILSVPFAYPLTYSIHVFDEEVYLFVRYQVDYFSLLAFGRSPISGAPGTGVWVAGTGAPGYSSGGIFSWGEGGISGSHFGAGNNSARTGLFIVSAGEGETSAGVYIHTGLTGWSGLAADMPKTVKACMRLCLIENPAANWNGQASLVPIQPYVSRPSNKVSIVGDLLHARFIRIDNYEPAQVFSLGADDWMVYPVYKKDASSRDGSADSSGTFGYAIRYDGP